MIEISVKVSNEEQNLVKKFLFYPHQDVSTGLEKSLFLSKEDPQLREMVEQTVKSFKGDVDEVRVTTKMVW